MAAPTDQTRGTRLRPYQPGDEEKVVTLWQRSLLTDPVTRDVFTARIRVPRARQALIALRQWLWQT